VSVIPECPYYPHPSPLNGFIRGPHQRKSKNLDSRLKISGMTKEEDSRLRFGNNKGEKKLRNYRGTPQDFFSGIFEKPILLRKP